MAVVIDEKLLRKIVEFASAHQDGEEISAAVAEAQGLLEAVSAQPDWVEGFLERLGTRLYLEGTGLPEYGLGFWDASPSVKEGHRLEMFGDWLRDEFDTSVKLDLVAPEEGRQGFASVVVVKPSRKLVDAALGMIKPK